MIDGVVTLRKVTLKSKMRGGKYDNLTFGEIAAMGDRAYLRWVYYNFAGIDFADDVKEAANIKPDECINKPGTDAELYERLKERNRQKLLTSGNFKWKKHVEKEAKKCRSARIARFNKAFAMTKGQMQAINQGHARWK